MKSKILFLSGLMLFMLSCNKNEIQEKTEIPAKKTGGYIGTLTVHGKYGDVTFDVFLRSLFREYLGEGKWKTTCPAGNNEKCLLLVSTEINSGDGGVQRINDLVAANDEAKITEFFNNGDWKDTPLKFLQDAAYNGILENLQSGEKTLIMIENNSGDQNIYGIVNTGINMNNIDFLSDEILAIQF